MSSDISEAPVAMVEADIGTLPRFLLASKWRYRLLVIMAVLAALAFVIWCGAAASANPMIRAVLSADAAALLLFVGALQSGYWISRWRAIALGPSEPPKVVKRRRRSKNPDTVESISDIKAYLLPRYRRVAAWAVTRLGEQGIESMWLIGLCTAGLAIVRHFWGGTLLGAALGTSGILGGGVLGLLAFGVLVLERDFARYPEIEWPEAKEFARGGRLVVATLMVSALAVLIDSPGSRWAPRLGHLAQLIPVLLAVEWLLRTAISFFSSRHPENEPALLAKSTVGALVTWPPPTLDNLQNDLKSRFGIDLRQNWAFSFVRRAALPVFIGVALVGWLSTGVSELAADRRGVYEVFGRPTAVVGPGLHAGLPWPFAKMRSVENGVVHEIATALPSEGDSAPDTSRAEDPAPISANRLWDASHVADKSLLIASARKEAQGFQIVNMDVRFFYRIALTPQGAMDALYQTTDLPALIRSTASRVLVDVFASRTLDGVLGEERQALAHAIGAAVQQHLDDVHSGVEVLATVVEAIHPPAGAADAYHSVQAAQISSEASISRERGQAAAQANRARQDATIAENEALADGEETMAAARAVESRFGAEQQAYRSAGNAFMYEYYLSQVATGLAKSSMTIVDHRIGASSAPTIDLRRYAPPGDYPSR